MAVKKQRIQHEAGNREQIVYLEDVYVNDAGSYFSNDYLDEILQELGAAAFTPGGSKVAVDVAATPDYLGNAYNDGALRTDNTTIAKTDGGNYVTLSVIPSGISHTDIADIGTNTHAQIDTHIADATKHFLMLDEDDMASNDDTKTATQQSIKAYIDTAVGGENLWDRNAGTATLSPHTANDNLDLGSGNFDTTGDITGGNVTSGADPGHTHTAYETAGAVAGHELAYDHTLLHDEITLDVNSDTLLSLTGQELGLDTQVKNIVLAGPASGVDAVPTFRALVADDIPDLSSVYDPAGTGAGEVASHELAYDHTLIATALQSETDPVVGAVTGIVVSNGAGVISAITDNSATWNSLVSFPGFTDLSTDYGFTDNSATWDTVTDKVAKAGDTMSGDLITTDVTKTRSSSFTYNADGTVATIVKASGRTLTFTYNADGTVNTIADGTYTKTFAYNADSTVASITVT